MTEENPAQDSETNAAAVVVVVVILLILVLIILWMSGAFVTPAPATPTP